MYSISNLSKLAHVGELLPDTMTAFRAWDKLALSDGAIPKKYKELMAIAVALTTQCPYCIEVHRQEAIKAGVTEKEFGGSCTRRSGAARGRCNHARNALIRGVRSFLCGLCVSRRPLR